MNNVALFYAIRDVDTGYFCPPFMATSDNDAKCMIRDSIEAKSVLHLYPSHYHVYRVGAFDGATGAMTPAFECICSVSDLVYRLPDPTLDMVSPVVGDSEASTEVQNG